MRPLKTGRNWSLPSMRRRAPGYQPSTTADNNAHHDPTDGGRRDEVNRAIDGFPAELADDGSAQATLKKYLGQFELPQNNSTDRAKFNSNFKWVLW